MDINLEIKGEISKLSLKPDDVLVVKLHIPNLPLATFYKIAERVREQVARVFKNNKVIIHGDYMDLSIIEKDMKIDESFLPQ